MSPETWTVLVTAVITPIIAVFALWLKRSLRLSDEAADAVSSTNSLRPNDVNQAITVLGIQVGNLGAELNELKVAFPQFVGWGKRGWERIDPADREPMPPLPAGFAELE